VAAVHKSAVSQPASSESTAKQARSVGKKKTIGAVLKEVKVEFPDVTLSKIRFLESEGLLCPSRSSSGYRRYSQADIDRLRYILTVQRDNYLPLKVIKEQLDEIDAGNAGGDGLASVTPLVTADQFREAAVVSLTQAELAERTGASEKFITELVRVGLITPDTLNMFDGDDLLITETAVKLAEFGLDARHLKTVRTAATREADLVSLAASPLSKSRAASGKQKAVEMGREMTALMVTLHGTLVKRQVNKDLGK